jgi:hypothetical protein
MVLSVSEIAKTPLYRRYRLDGVSVEDAIERVRSFGAFRRAAAASCEQAASSLRKRESAK